MRLITLDAASLGKATIANFQLPVFTFDNVENWTKELVVRLHELGHANLLLAEYTKIKFGTASAYNTELGNSVANALDVDSDQAQREAADYQRFRNLTKREMPDSTWEAPREIAFPSPRAAQAATSLTMSHNERVSLLEDTMITLQDLLDNQSLNPLEFAEHKTEVYRKYGFSVARGPRPTRERTTDHSHSEYAPETKSEDAR